MAASDVQNLLDKKQNNDSEDAENPQDTQNEGHLSNDKKPKTEEGQNDSDGIQPEEDNACIRKLQKCWEKCDCVLLEVLKFILGVWKPPCECTCSCGCGKCMRRIICSFVPIVCLVWSITTVSIYLFCYFGRANHLLIFLSFLSYWLSIMSPQIICTIAICHNFWYESYPDEDIPEDVHGRHVFHETYISNHFRGIKKWVFVYLIAGLCLLALRVVFFVNLLKECQTLFDKFWMINDWANIIFYTLFCYFLCLQRKALEKKGLDCFISIRDKSKTLDDCKKDVVTFLKDYKGLRRVVIPWIWMIFFFSSCGLTAVFTWNYNSVLDPPPPTPEPCMSWCCKVTCDKVPLLIANDEYRTLSNATVMIRNILITLFAFHAVYGSDLKHVWDTFRMRLFSIYSAEKKAKIQEIIQFMDSLYTESTPDSLGIVFSIAGVLVGILGGENFR